MESYVELKMSVPSVDTILKYDLQFNLPTLLMEIKLQDGNKLRLSYYPALHCIVKQFDIPF